MKHFLKIFLFIIIAAGVAIGSVLTIRAVNNRGAAPVGWWKMDEGQGQTTYDASGNGNNGTLGASTSDTTPDPAWKNEESCKNGKCLQFDGSNDYVDAGDCFYSNTLTISAWIYPTFLDGNLRNIVVKRNNPGVAASTMEWYFAHISSKLSFAATASGGAIDVVVLSGTSNLSLNTWQFASVTCDGSKCYMYLNGKLDGSTDQTGIIGDTASLVQIGARSMNNDNRWFTGSIDDVRIFNYARTASQIKADYNKSAGGKGASVKVASLQEQQNASDGLVGYWKMDEASWAGAAGEVVDSSGAGNNGAAVGGASTTSPAKFGRAGNFDGSNDYVDAGNGASLNITGSITVEGWVKPDVVNTWQRFASRGEYSTGWITGITNTGKADITAQIQGGGLVTMYGLTTLQAGQWYHIVGVIDSSTQKIYIYLNGKLDNTPLAFAGSIANPNVSDLIGTSGNITTYPFNGLIDDVKIYNKARTAEQIRMDYDSGPPPIGYWKFDENTGATAYDTSGSGYNGTLTGGPVWVPGKYGSGVRFSTTGQYIQANGFGNIAPKNEITIGFWAKMDSLAGNQNAFWVGNDSPDRINVHFIWSGSQYWDFGTCCTPRVAITPTIPANEWHYYTYISSVQGGYMRIYKDGNIIGSNTSPGTFTAANYPLYIGNTPAGTYPLLGTIDEFRVYNYVRTQKQIMEDMNAGHPAVGSPVGSYSLYLPFDEGQGDTAYDKSVNKNNGDLAGSCPGAATCPTWTTAGKFGKALSFDGGDYVDIADTAAFKLQQFSISAWFKVSDYSVTRPIFGNYNYNMYYGYNLDVGTDGKIYFQTTNSIGGLLDQVVSTNAVTTGSWYHVVVTLDGSAIKMYVNGVYDNQDSSQQTLVYDTLHYPTIGRNTYRTAGGYQRFFSGLIDDVKIYPFALSPAEIKEEFNRGSSLKLGASGTEADGITPSNSALSAYCVPGDTTSCSAPVAHWKMDEKTGDTAYDTSGNGNNGDLAGACPGGATCPAWKSAASCKKGACLQFDGSNDYVSINGNPDLLRGSRTYELWFYPHFNSDSGGVYGMLGSNVDGSNTITLYNYSNGFYGVAYKAGGVAHYISAGSFTANHWYHIAFTFDDDTNIMKVYHNGVFQNQDTESNAMVAGTVTTLIGEYVLGSTNFDGLIDDVRIYNYARTPAQIAWDYNRGGPVASWSMDSVGVSASPGTALNVYDSSGKANTGVSSGETMNNGTLTSGPTWKDGSNCKYGSCLSFDGTDDYIYTTDIKTLGNFTYSAWVKLNSAPTGSLYIFDKEIGGSLWPSVRLSVNSDSTVTFQFYKSSSIGQSVVTTDTLGTGVWYHLVGTYDGGKLRIYINGILSKEADASGTPNDINNELTIGAAEFNTVPYFRTLWNGSIDNVRIYNTALTAAQVAALYNNNDRAAGASLEGNLVGEWRFDENASLYAADTHYQRNGKYGYAMNFDGSNDYVNVGSGSSLHPTKYITISVWVKPGSTQLIYADIMGNHAVGSGLNGYTIQQSGSNLNKFGFSYGNGSTWQGGTVLTQLVANQWNHYVVQKDDTVMRSYLNGVLVGQENVSGDIVYGTTHPIYIGVGWTNLTRYFNGLIDDVRVYNYALTPLQVKTLYNENSAVRFGPTEGLP